MTMTLEEAYEEVKNGMKNPPFYMTENTLAAINRLLELVRDINKRYAQNEATWWKTHKDYPHYSQGANLRLSFLEMLGAWKKDKEPKEVCCGCGCELPDEGRMKYTVVTSHPGGKRVHEVCQECFVLINHEAQVLEKREYRDSRYKYRRLEEAGYPLYMDHREIYERAIYNVLGTETVYTTRILVPDEPTKPKVRIGQEW